MSSTNRETDILDTVAQLKAQIDRSQRAAMNLASVSIGFIRAMTGEGASFTDAVAPASMKSLSGEGAGFTDSTTGAVIALGAFVWSDVRWGMFQWD